MCGMKNQNNINVVDLSFEEMRDTNGGVFFALAGLLIACFAVGYEIGRDSVERDRRLQAQQ